MSPRTSRSRSRRVEMRAASPTPTSDVYEYGTKLPLATLREAFRAPSYALWDEAGAPSVQANAIARPYPRRVAGEPLRWSWESAPGKFTAKVRVGKHTFYADKEGYTALMSAAMG